MQLIFETNPSLINDNDDAGETTLSIAADRGNKSLVEVLIRKGADVNKLAKNGVSSLFFSVQSKYEDISRILMDNKAEINHKRKSDGFTALHITVITKQLDMTLLLVCKGGEHLEKSRWC